MICDYYIVRKGYLDVKSLYSARNTDPYYYTLGFSWRAYTSYFCGIIINIVGFAGAVGRSVPVGAQYVYNVNYFSGVLVAGTVYYALARLFPVPATSAVWNEVGVDDEFSVAYGQEVVSDEEIGGEHSPDFSGDDQKGLREAAKKV